MHPQIITTGQLPRPRWARQLKAFVLGYFWLPCPICGEMFAGFECGDASVPYPDRSHGARIACKRHLLDAH